MIDLNAEIPGCSHFFWREFLWLNTWEVHVFPANEEVKQNIIRVANAMERVRAYLDHEPIRVTSGYRPPRYNEIIGGAKYSQHRLGNACDFIHNKLSAERVRELLLPVLDDFNIRMEDLSGASWVHIDLRDPGRGGRFFRP